MADRSADRCALASVERCATKFPDGSFIVPKPQDSAAWVGSRTSPAARALRVLAEVSEPRERFEAAGVRATILFFGSARALSPEEHAAANAREEAAMARPGADTASCERALDKLRKIAWMCPVYALTQELARRLSSWSMERCNPPSQPLYCVVTGGGPGLMEAANRGAAAAGGLSAGIAVSLPFEVSLNAHVTPELGFLHHYFFTRKVTLSYLARALVVLAGGFGTLDELFELLTLLQTGKIDHADSLPVVLFPGSYWREAINWSA